MMNPTPNANRKPRWTVLLLGAGLVVALGLALFFAIDFAWQTTPTPPATPATPAVADTDMNDGDMPFNLSAMVGDEPLAHEPADLEPFPNAQAQHRFVRDLSGARKEVSAWRIDDAPLREVVEFYQQQAAAQGFRAVEHPDAPGNDTPDNESTLLFVGNQSETLGQVLTIRCATQTDTVHVLIALQYPASR